MRDYYEILGVDRAATPDIIKKAYRGLAMKCHPDRNPGDKDAEQRFKQINEAYDILKDEQKRAAYDRFGHAAFENGANGAGGFGFRAGPGGFADIFDEMFGEFMGRRGGQTRGRGADLRYNMEITLEEAFTGKTATVKVPTSTTCEACSGTGGEHGAKAVTCPTCHGSGKLRASQGFFLVERTCAACQGAGRIIEKPCRSCHGSGRARKEKTLNVTIPAGVEDGTRIRLAGEGEAGIRGAPPGDLYIFLGIKQHAMFVRDAADIHCRVPVPMTTAALGGSIEVPAIDGTRTKVNVPAGTQSGARFRLRAKGMSVLRTNQRGDMYVQVNVEVPINLTKKQRELLEEFDKAGGRGKSHSPEAEGFFAKVKELWQELKE
jgi:molecular chaperone DnaJ